MDPITFRHFVDNPIELIYKNVLQTSILYYCYLAGDYLFFVLPKFIYMYIIQHFIELICYVTVDAIKHYLYFTHLHMAIKCQYLLDITVTDYYEAKYRFQLTYNVISTYSNLRFFIKALVGELVRVPSIEDLFRGATWYEREIWDFFGIVFVGNQDLRRLLTDYAFEGYPLKKDFPLGGFFEVRYSEFIKRLSYLSVKSIQEFKTFELVNPWTSTTKFKYSDLYSLYKMQRNTPLHLNYL